MACQNLPHTVPVDVRTLAGIVHTAVAAGSTQVEAASPRLHLKQHKAYHTEPRIPDDADVVAVADADAVVDALDASVAGTSAADTSAVDTFAAASASAFASVETGVAHVVPPLSTWKRQNIAYPPSPHLPSPPYRLLCLSSPSSSSSWLPFLSRRH